jgi:hypothetical protein
MVQGLPGIGQRDRDAGLVSVATLRSMYPARSSRSGRLVIAPR